MSETGDRWQIILDRSVEKVLRRLPHDLLKRIDRAIQRLAIEPRPHGCTKLTGFASLYRLRVGDWRLIYSIEEDRLVVLVLEIAPRGKAYRNL